MTNAALLLQSLSLSSDTAPRVLDQNDGSGVAWTDTQLTFTTAEPSYEGDAEQRTLSFPVAADELIELHRILTAHLSGAEYADELATEGGWVVLGARGKGLRLEAGIGEDVIEILMTDTAVASWHTKLTLTLLAAALD